MGSGSTVRGGRGRSGPVPTTRTGYATIAARTCAGTLRICERVPARGVQPAGFAMRTGFWDGANRRICPDCSPENVRKVLRLRSHSRRSTNRWAATSSQRPRVITRGAFLFSANVHALLRLIDHERSTRVPIAKSTRFLLPGADLGVRALCLGDPGREHGGWFTAPRVRSPRPSKAGLRSNGDTIRSRFSSCSLVHSFTTSALVCATDLA